MQKRGTLCQGFLFYSFPILWLRYIYIYSFCCNVYVYIICIFLCIWRGSFCNFFSSREPWLCIHYPCLFSIFIGSLLFYYNIVEGFHLYKKIQQFKNGIFDFVRSGKLRYHSCILRQILGRQHWSDCFLSWLYVWNMVGMLVLLFFCESFT